MKIVTMLFITLLTGAAGVGAWIVLKDDVPNSLQGMNSNSEKPKLKKTKWREAPYVIFAPAETLPEKHSSISPPPRQPDEQKITAAPAAPSPEPIVESAPPPVTPGSPATTSSIAQQALESVIGTQEPAKEKKTLKLPYEANAGSRTEALQEKQSLLTGKQMRFRKVTPLSSGTLKSGNTTISLAGLDALVADASCTYASGKSWECGRWGKYALRRLIRGRSISCDAIEPVTENIVAARCNVAGVDINEWVVRRGWGRPSGPRNKEYDIAFKAAKDDRLGQWSLESASN